MAVHGRSRGRVRKQMAHKCCANPAPTRSMRNYQEVDRHLLRAGSGRSGRNQGGSNRCFADARDDEIHRLDERCNPPSPPQDRTAASADQKPRARRSEAAHLGAEMPHRRAVHDFAKQEENVPRARLGDYERRFGAIELPSAP